MSIRTIRWIGFVFYCIAYFLPAIGNHNLEYSLPGYDCAFFSVVWGVAGIFDPSALTHEGRKFILSLLLPGLTNPLVLAYLGLTLRSRAVRVRRVLAVLIVFFMASSVVSLMTIRMAPFVGFYVWILGLTMILSPDLLLAISKMRHVSARSRA